VVDIDALSCSSERRKRRRQRHPRLRRLPLLSRPLVVRKVSHVPFMHCAARVPRAIHRDVPLRWHPSHVSVVAHVGAVVSRGVQPVLQQKAVRSTSSCSVPASVPYRVPQRLVCMCV
jgi:hypothetical protein